MYLTETEEFKNGTPTVKSLLLRKHISKMVDESKAVDEIVNALAPEHHSHERAIIRQSALFQIQSREKLLQDKRYIEAELFRYTGEHVTLELGRK